MHAPGPASGGGRPESDAQAVAHTRDQVPIGKGKTMADSKKNEAMMKKLKGLYQLAILQDGEEKNESRRIEAASSALLLLNLARKNGIRITFAHADEAKKKEEDDKDKEWWMNPLENFVTEASKRALKDIVKDLTSK